MAALELAVDAWSGAHQGTKCWQGSCCLFLFYLRFVEYSTITGATRYISLLAAQDFAAAAVRNHQSIEARKDPAGLLGDGT